MSAEVIKKRLEASVDVKRAILSDGGFLDSVDRLGSVLADTLAAGGKLVVCGNGGSASDALHFAGEIVGRFMTERRPLPAIALNSDVATLTAIANDYGYDEAFARQARVHCGAGDLFVGISTSGNSENVLRAVRAAHEKGARTAALLGKGGGKIADEVDFPVIVPSDVTACIQESHIAIIHALCEMVDLRID